MGGCCIPCDEDENLEDINGECPDCGADTIDGIAVERCAYSPVDCETCENSPCDGSC